MSLPNSVELELRVTVQLDVSLISNDYSTNGVALYVKRGSIHALETAIGKQLQNNIYYSNFIHCTNSDFLIG